MLESIPCLLHGLWSTYRSAGERVAVRSRCGGGAGLPRAGGRLVAPMCTNSLAVRKGPALSPSHRRNFHSAAPPSYL